MAGAITIVVVLLIFPVLVLLSGGIASAILGQSLGGRRRAAQRGQRAARTARLIAATTCSSPTPRTQALTEAIVRYAVERVDLDPPPLDGPRWPEELRAAAGPHDHRRRGVGGAEALRIFAEVLAPACISVDHPRFSVLRAGGTDGRVDPVRPRRRGLEHLRRIVAGGRRRDPRRERGAARGSPSSPGCPPTAGGVFVSGGTAGNLSALLAARWRLAPSAPTAATTARGG